MNAKEHIIGGVIATTFTYIAAMNVTGQTVTPEGLFKAALLGVPAGLALDILEPAIHPNHRGPAHSITALLGLAVIAGRTWDDSTLNAESKALCMAVFAGVASHHGLDATTPKGLPLIGFRLNDI